MIGVIHQNDCQEWFGTRAGENPKGIPYGSGQNLCGDAGNDRVQVFENNGTHTANGGARGF